MKNYKVGVLLSAYNGEKYIVQQIESIMNQTIKEHLTLIIRDDGSTDNTSKILDKLKAQYPNIKVIKGENLGLIASFFKLLNIAVNNYNFDYYSFSDQDDYWLQDKLEIAVRDLRKENSNIPLLYGCRSFIVDENLRKTGFITQSKQRKVTFFNTAIQNIIPGHNQVLNKKLAEILVNKNINFQNVYSQDLWIINVAVVTGKIIFDNTAHTLYRMHGNNELGYGKGIIDRLHAHLLRLRKKETHKMAIQLKYFVRCYDNFISLDQKKEIKLFLKSQHNFRKRLSYIKNSKLYRQSNEETFLFKILYLFKQYSF